MVRISLSFQGWTYADYFVRHQHVPSDNVAWLGHGNQLLRRSRPKDRSQHRFVDDGLAPLIDSGEVSPQM